MSLSLAERFWPKVKKSLGCWEWQGSLGTWGYGQININRKPVPTHRVALMLSGIDISGKCVLHRCDNPKCVRPDHLFLGTKADNSRDMVTKGRQCRGERHHWAKLTDKEVCQIRNSKMPQDQLSRIFGVNQSQISRIKTGARRATFHLSVPEVQKASGTSGEVRTPGQPVDA
jgi:hypothetical protein